MYGTSSILRPLLAAGIAASGLALAPTVAAAQRGTLVDQTAACCTITAIDARTGTVTGKVTATNAVFTLKVADASWLKALAVGQALDFSEDVACTGNAATGTTNCGSNVGRNADTRPKECIATNSAGQQYKVTCPDNVPTRATK